MKIISTYRDYYDWCAHAYGVDENVVLDRRPFNPDPDTMGSVHHIGTKEDSPKIYHLFDDLISKGFGAFLGYDAKREMKSSLLIVAGRCFLLERERIYPLKGAKVTAVDLGDDSNEMWWFDERRHQRYIKSRIFREHLKNPGTFDESAANLCVAIGRPIVIIDGYNPYSKAIEVWNAPPPLGDLGVASWVEAEVIYRDLNNFIQSRMTSDPDKMPESDVPHKVKVESKGFDYVKSFRHRK